MIRTFSSAARCAALVLFAALLGASTQQTSTPETILEYAVRNADGSELKPVGRRIFCVSGFTVRLKAGERQGKPALIVRREDRTTQGARFDWKFTADAAGNLLESEKKITMKDGTVIDEARQSFAHLKPTAGIPIVHVQMFPLLPRFLKPAPGAVLNADLAMQPESRPFGIILTVDGEETITVPAGTFNCYILQVASDPEDMPSFMKYLPSYISSMFMNYTMWVDKKAPYTLVRLQGKTDGPDGDDKIQELVKITRNP